MNLSPNNINGSLPHVPVNLEGNPANPPVQPIQEVPVQQVLPDIENPVIPVEVPAGISPIGPTWLEEISTEPFTLEKAIEVFDVFEKSNLTYLMLDRMNNESNLIECVKYVINNYPHDIINDESFLDIIRVLLSLRKHQEPSRFCLLHTNDLLSFFRKVSPLALMEEERWKKYFEDVFLNFIEFSLGKKEDHYFDRIKLFLILFGENKDYCEMLFDQTYCKNQDTEIFKELFAKSEKTEEEFKIYLKNKLFGSNILFYIGVTEWTTSKLKNYYDFLDEKSKGLPHPFLCHRNVKSARNVAPQTNEAEKLEEFCKKQGIDEHLWELIRLLDSLRSPNADVEDIKRQIKDLFKELFGQNKDIAQELMNINQNFLNLYGSILFNEQDVRDVVEDLKIEVNHTTSNDDGKPTEGKKEEKKESSE